MEKVKYWRALVIGGLFSFIICFVDPIRVMVSKGASMTSDYSIGAAFFYFFIIVLINGLIGKINKRFSLNTEELVIIFGMMAVSCAIPTWGFALNLIPLMPGIYYYADPSWEASVIPYVNKAITVSDKNAIDWFFEGLPKGYTVPWDKWLIPLTLWFVLIFSVYLLSILVMYFVSKRWIEEERLLYPITIPPVELLKKENTFPPVMKDKLFYLGILIPFIILGLYCLHIYFPSIPPLILSRTYSIFRRTTGINIRVAFEVIGLIYFISLDVSFSLWLFFLLFTMQKGMFNITGFGTQEFLPYNADRPLLGWQSLGSLIVIVLYGLWISRKNLLRIIKAKEGNEIISPKTASIGMIICFLFIYFWLLYSGLSPLPSILFIFFAFLIYIGITR
ncbi:MAG: hypothetical protein NC932_01970, partial [Candidatus Omnitrophica bacterium]|nr:hypothetical protein [Candidatus Omnitrophota bacterium]